MIRVYLAGPDVFREFPENCARGMKTECTHLGLEGVFPMDVHVPPGPTQAANIFSSNVALIRSCRAVLANMAPFRGPSMDVGTAWEVGFAYALGLPIVGYYRGVPMLDYASRVRMLPPSGETVEWPVVEDFGLPENLMLPFSMNAVCPFFGAAARVLAELLGTKEEAARCSRGTY